MLPDGLPNALLLPGQYISLFGGRPALYFSGEDSLKWTAYNSGAGVGLALRGRFLAKESGAVRELARELVPATDRSASSAIVPLEEGWLFDAHVLAVAGTPQVGQCFVVLSLVRGQQSSGIELATFAAGYVTPQQRLAFPESGVRSSLDGRGAIVDVTGSNPGAGTEWSETMPTGARRRLLGLTTTFVSDATVITRVSNFVIDNGTLIFFRVGPSATQAASITQVQTLAPAGFTGVANGGSNQSPAPFEPILRAGDRIRTITTNIQAADDYSAPQMRFEEWIEP